MEKRNLRCRTKSGKGWQEVDLPDPMTYDSVNALLRELDGTESVIIDDDRHVFYCGSQSLIDRYKQENLAADTFYPLAKELWERDQQAA